MLDRWKRESKQRLAKERDLAKSAGDIHRPGKGEEVLIEAHGKGAILKKSPNGRDYSLRLKGVRDPVPGPAFSVRFGSWPRIKAEVGHFRLYGALSHVDWSKVPH